MPNLSIYRPPESCYLHDARGIHGLGHAARVLVWADRIVAWMREQNIEVDGDAVRWAAALHDVRRLDDGDDILHGERAARWIHSGGAAGFMILDEPRQAIVEYCCRWHVPADERAPAMTPELICLKDADGLDRVRLGDLDPARLRTPYARQLPDAAQDLYDRSVLIPGDPWEAVASLAAEAKR